MSKFIDVEEEVIVDGETVQSKKYSYKKTSAATQQDLKYFSIHKEDLSKLLSLTGTELKLFLFLSSHLSFVTSDNRVDISRSIRKEFKNILQFEDVTVRNTLSRLRKKGLLVSVDESTELLSPYHVMCGEVKKVKSIREEFDSLKRKST